VVRSAVGRGDVARAAASARRLTLKALGRPPGISALVMAYSVGYEESPLPTAATSATSIGAPRGS
jgi:hypothetical protein